MWTSKWKDESFIICSFVFCLQKQMLNSTVVYVQIIYINIMIKLYFSQLSDETGNGSISTVETSPRGDK